MEALKKKVVTAGAVIVIGALIFVTGMALCQEEIQSLRRKIDQKAGYLTEYQRLLTNRKAIEEEWKESQVFFQSHVSSGQALNLWVKALIVYAEDQGVVFEKLEPRKIRKSKKGEELGVFLMFRGDIRKFVRFLYQLYKKDPMVRIEDFSIQHQEGVTGFSYELTLAKGIG